MTANAKSVPEWAMREFCDRANLNFDEVFRGPNTVVLRYAILAGGKLIAEHEEAPVDPLERAMAQANGVLRGEGNGTYDEALDALRDVLTALELAGESK